MSKSVTAKLDPKAVRVIKKQLASGNYKDADDVVQQGIFQLFSDYQMMARLWPEVEIGLKQARRGEFVEYTADDIKREGRRLLRARKKAG